MDIGNQARIKELAAKYGKDQLLVVIGGAEAEASGLAVETVANGDPAFAGPLAGVQLGLRAYHVMEPEIKNAVDPVIYDQQVGMMEMVLDVEAIIAECRSIRQQFLGDA
jgi:betaine reductase